MRFVYTFKAKKSFCLTDFAFYATIKPKIYTKGEGA